MTDCVTKDANLNSEQGAMDEKKEQGKKLSPLSTLESSFSALNVKKFDVAFVVDALYHQTSAQFDEGGAKGLLLNNLGVYGNYRVPFDSLEMPGKCSSPVSQCDGSETLDLSFASDCIQQMVLSMCNSSEISPSLRDIVNQFDKDDQMPTETYAADQSCSGQANESPYKNADFNNDTFGNCVSLEFDHDDQSSVVDEGNYDQDANFPIEQESPNLANEQFNLNEPDEDDRFGEVDSYLFLSLGFPLMQNAWAGPDHWKYRKVQDPEVPTKQNGSPKAKKTRTRRAELEMNIFSSVIDNDISHIFVPPKNRKSLLMPANAATRNTKLPEDCHYQLENLVKLSLLPNVLCLGKCGRRRTVEENQPRDEYGATGSWDDDGFCDAFDEGHAYSDTEEPTALVSQPRQVNKIEVQFDKTSKQVDVQALKETLWDSMRQLDQEADERGGAPEAAAISFKQVLASFPNSCSAAAASASDISPHLCFICLLHLGNEHGLTIVGRPSMDDLTILMGS